MSVYLIAAHQVSLAKIGVAQDVQSRLQSLQTANPYELTIVAERDGERPLEASIHSACRHLHVRGEWFRYEPELLTLFQSTELNAALGDRTHADIVKSAGPDAVAERRGVSIHTVRSWIARDKIPDEHWAAFANEGSASLEELASYAAKRRAA